MKSVFGARRNYRQFYIIEGQFLWWIYSVQIYKVGFVSVLQKTQVVFANS